MTDYEAIFEQAFKDAKSGSTRSLSDNLRCDRVALAAVVAAAKAEALEEAATWAADVAERMSVGSYSTGPSGREQDLWDKYWHASEWLAGRAENARKATQ